MTVKELIEQLKDYDPNVELFVRGYEGGWDRVESTFQAEMVLDVNKKWYYGSHEVLVDGQEKPKNKKVVKGVILKA